MNIIITGGRHSLDRKSVYDFLDTLLMFNNCELVNEIDILGGDTGLKWVHKITPDPFTIVQGGATGIDKFARDWCMKRGVNFKNYPYPKHLGKSGGPVRNRDMAQKEKPAFVVAFAGGKGTRSMTRIAEEMGIPVILAGQVPKEEPKWQPRYVQPERTAK